MEAEEVGRTPVAHDLRVWRESVRTVESLAALRGGRVNLITGDGAGEPVEVGRMTASGFAVARVAPLLGRTLVDADEAAGAERNCRHHRAFRRRARLPVAVPGSRSRISSASGAEPGRIRERPLIVLLLLAAHVAAPAVLEMEVRELRGTRRH
jgi:hypothetical protein